MSNTSIVTPVAVRLVRGGNTSSRKRPGSSGSNVLALRVFGRDGHEAARLHRGSGRRGGVAGGGAGAAVVASGRVRQWRIGHVLQGPCRHRTSRNAHEVARTADPIEATIFSQKSPFGSATVFPQKSTQSGNCSAQANAILRRSERHECPRSDHVAHLSEHHIFQSSIPNAFLNVLTCSPLLWALSVMPSIAVFSKNLLLPILSR